MTLEDDLRQILRKKADSVVWVVGTGVVQGALRGTPSEPYTSWAGLLRSGLRRIHELGKITADELTDHERLLGHDNLTTWLLVAETITQGLGAPASGEFRRWLRETVGEFEKHLADHTVLDALADHQRRGGLLATTNYDFLLETVTGLTAATWRTPADVERALRGEEPQVLHLHGAWRWTDSVVLGIRSYDDVVRDPHARAVLTTLRTGRTFVFVGCGAGLRDPNMGAFLKWTATAYAGSEYRHFRLCRKSDLEALRREHPDAQRIFPLSYGEDHAALAPFLRSLLPPGAPTHAAPIPVLSPPRFEPVSLPTPTPVITLAAPLPAEFRWDVALRVLLAKAFTNDELQLFLADTCSEAVIAGLPGVDVPRDRFSFESVELLKRYGACNHRFFVDLRKARPHRGAEIDPIQRDCLGTQAPTLPSSSSPSPAAPSTSLAQFALVVDRSDQWQELSGALRDQQRHFVAVVHGDERQDVKLFIERTLRWANGTFKGIPPKVHELITVQCYQDGACPRTRDTWLSRIIQAVTAANVDRGELPEMLRTLSGRRAALIVFVGADGGGLIDGGTGLTLGERNSFLAALASLVRALPADAPHPIRILVPVEHATDAGAADPLVVGLHQLARQTSIHLIPLQELDFPTWMQVLPSLRDECGRRGHDNLSDPDLVRAFRPVYDACKTSVHSFAALGLALSRALDHQCPVPNE